MPTSSLSLLLATLGALSTVYAVVIPTTPAPGVVFNQGSKCSTSWIGDEEGKWSEMRIDLMTGNNFQMVPLATIGSGLDGNKDGTVEFTCPEVTPHSAIYFFQYSSPSSPGVLQWATRFTIADSNGGTEPPPETTQPDGASIPWGVGRLGGGSNEGSGSSSTLDTTTSTTTSTSTPTANANANDIPNSFSSSTSDSVPVTGTTFTTASLNTVGGTRSLVATGVISTGTGMTTVRNFNSQATVGTRTTAGPVTTTGASGTGSSGGTANQDTNTNGALRLVFGEVCLTGHVTFVMLMAGLFLL